MDLGGENESAGGVEGVAAVIERLDEAGYGVDTQILPDKARIYLKTGHVLEYANGAVRGRVSVPAHAQGGGVGIVGRRYQPLHEEPEVMEILDQVNIPYTGPSSRQGF